jgi:beta-phosphoglucomutase-like phosphatase (HAD superfamily)
MDGLLFDTERLYREALYIAAADAGHEVVPDFFNRTLGLPWPECRLLLLSHFGETFAVDDFQAVWIKHFWVIAETRLTLKPSSNCSTAWISFGFREPSPHRRRDKPSSVT